MTDSSPIFSMLNSPHSVPRSDSRMSSIRLTMVAPTASAIRLLSDFRTRRMAETFARSKTYCAVSEKNSVTRGVSISTRTGYAFLSDNKIGLQFE